DAQRGVLFPIRGAFRQFLPDLQVECEMLECHVQTFPLAVGGSRTTLLLPCREESVVFGSVADSITFRPVARSLGGRGRHETQEHFLIYLHVVSGSDADNMLAEASAALAAS